MLELGRLGRLWVVGGLLSSLAGCTLLSFDASVQDLAAGGSGGEGGEGGTPFVKTCADVTCNDGNPCTVDACDPATVTCKFTPDPGTLCGDDDLCNGVDVCSAEGQCLQVEAPIDPADADPCTADACAPETGQVTHEPIAGCRVETPSWVLLPTEGAPAARRRHSAVWTGSKMVVWGGLVREELVLAATATGALYDPVTNTWAPMSSVGAPPPRHSHTAVWTGDRMLVWGGYGLTGYETGGGLYDPETDTWQPISSVGAPSGRTLHSAVWTGTELIVWGGLFNVGALNTGARYRLADDAWQPLPPTPLARRHSHMAVYTGSHMILWGGGDTFEWLDTGYYFERGINAWTGAVAIANRPVFRERASAVWTGAEMIVWGGWDGGNYLPTGGVLNPAVGPVSGTWRAMTLVNAPAGRADHVTLWLGDALWVWGGCGDGDCRSPALSDGGRYVPDATGGVWSPVLADPTLPPRSQATGVYTGQHIIVWGGRNTSGTLLRTGAIANSNQDGE